MADAPQTTPRERTSQILTAARGAAERCGRDDLVERLDRATERFNHPEVTLLVLGEFKQGKSSLVNAIVNAQVCPVDDDVATAVATIVHHSENHVASIIYDGPDDPDEEVHSAIQVEDAAAFVRSGMIAGSTQRVRAVQIGLPRNLLASGLRIVDTPGVGGLDSAHGMATMGALSMADAVLFVTDSSQELTASELDFLRRANERCPTCICVMPKIDFYPPWRTILERNQNHLATAGIAVEILPVSSELRVNAVARDDRELNGESGFPPLMARLRDDIIAQSELTHIRSALNDARAVVDQLHETEQTELDSLTDPSKREELTQQAAEARERADAMKSAAARWATTLNDGVADLTANTDHDMRQRSRALLAEIDELIDANDPVDIGDELFPMVEQRLMADVAENYTAMRDQATELSIRVLDLFDADAPMGEVPDFDAPLDVFSDVGTLEVEIAERPGMAQGLLTGMRGGYGGAMMFGMVGGIVGLATFGPLSLGAGALLGRKAAKEDRQRQLTLRQQQAKQGIRKFIDEVTFRTGKHSRDTLREIQRELRDANLARAQELSTTANQAFMAAQNAVQLDENETNARTEALTASLDQLARIKTACDEIESA